MKFESKYGVGEICIYNEEASRGDRVMPDLLVKVVAVTFELDGKLCYTVEHSNDRMGIQRITTYEKMLTGDPIFNQETGDYPQSGEGE